MITCLQAPVVSRRVAPIVCQAAAVEAAPVAEPVGIKGGVAKQTFQRGSPHKVDEVAGARCCWSDCWSSQASGYGSCIARTLSDVIGEGYWL